MSNQSSTEKSVPSGQHPPDQVKPQYRSYVLFILTLVYVFNFVDRQILVVLQESIKKDLDLTDLQLGLMTGAAFAIFYVSVGLPIARWADRANRKNIITLSLTIWSFFTVLSGKAGSFFQMLMARIGVGIGEAGGSPPAHSMITDYYPPHKRATALGIYSSGIYIGVLVGYLGGGIINQAVGWRTTFMVVGLPGIILALVLYFTVKEPIRGYYEGGSKEQVKFMEVVRFLLSRPTFVWMALATGFHTFVLYGTGNFFISFLERVHEMSTLDASIALALLSGLAGALGTYFGGRISDKLAAKDKRWYLWYPILSIVISLPFAPFIYFLDNTTLALAFYLVPVFFLPSYLGPCISVTHSMVPPNMRTFASAVLFFVLNLIGLGLGPVFAGGLSDYLTPSLGAAEALRWSLFITTMFGIVGLVMFWKASKTLRADLDRVPV